MRMRVSRILAAVAAVALLVAPTAAFAEGAASFPDFSASAWWAPGMYTAAALGLVQGVGQPNGQATLDPAGTVTRAQWATMLVRAGGYAHPVPSGAQPFTDLSASDWFAPYVDSLVKAGVVRPGSGAYPGGDFKPNAPISRAQAAAWAGRVLRQRGASLKSLGTLQPVTVANAATQTALNKGAVPWGQMHWASVTLPSAQQSVTFSDLPTTTPGYTSIMDAARYGVIDGFPGGTFQPDGTLTRAQSAKMVAIMVNELTAQPPTLADLMGVAQHVDDTFAVGMASLPAGPVTAAQAAQALQTAGLPKYATPAALDGPDGMVQAVVEGRKQIGNESHIVMHVEACHSVFAGTTVAELECAQTLQMIRVNGSALWPQPIQQGSDIYFALRGGQWQQTQIQIFSSVPPWAAQALGK